MLGCDYCVHTCLCWDIDESVRGQHSKRTVLFSHSLSPLAWFQIVSAGNKGFNLLKHIVSPVMFLLFQMSLIKKKKGGWSLLVACIHHCPLLHLEEQWLKMYVRVFMLLSFFLSLMFCDAIYTSTYMFFFLCAWFPLRV